MNNQMIKRGDVWLANLGVGEGSEQSGLRPCVVIQNSIGNLHAPTVIIAAITGQISKARLPVHVELKADEVGFVKDSVVLCEQIRTINKTRLVNKVTELDRKTMKKINKAIIKSLELEDEIEYKILHKPMATIQAQNTVVV